MKVVAVSQRVDISPATAEVRDGLDQRLSGFLLAAGYLPVPVPNLLGAADRQAADSLLDAWLAAVRPHAIVLSGGNDIAERPERDAVELALLEHAATRHMPVLGICRGMQMLAHWAGTGLRPVSAHVACRHRLVGQIEDEVNSYHCWALADCPEGFDALARSEDGCLEAIAHRQLPWQGWMWHPEREPSLRQLDINRLKALFE
ncbi:gamma-glutamyl-gamma-aminobutyrate hydrolase family protein [Pseudomonas sp. CAN2814]|uniref:gamma-glutamyl-gamma-aminobutyrate hydrolase family protein n=1 Tax=Pseudomonas sp. CAN1 TaxID=3046726 RepID=UPI002648E087|nr:gamma-glutamyl-gamma-aminobutyrate hydrolase family protein [Pseudomonas sp. CAN1]MDN6857488.1 gamma-glutamyl-gamma-aminobutyrate hydrolase family protein [Pseudomonas sp. CAN1]